MEWSWPIRLPSLPAACLLTDSMYSLVVSDNGGIGAGNETLGRGFAGVGEVVGRDGTTEAGSTGRGGVSKVSIGIGVWTSGVDTSSGTGVEVDSGTEVGASCCSRSASDILASNPGAGLPDWYPAKQSLHGLVHTDPDPDPSFRLIFRNLGSGYS